MNFGANETPIEVIREGAFGGIYFRDIYFRVNGKLYKKSWKELDQLKDIDQKFYCSDYYDYYYYDYYDFYYGWFHWYSRYWLCRRSSDDERQINR